MSDTALDITPTSPTPKASQSGSQDKSPSSPNYESWDIRRVNPFAKPERGMSGHVLAKFDLHQEYETHDLLLVLESALTNVHLGKDMSQMAEVIMQKLPDWNKRARDLELLKMDDDELRRLAVEDKEKSKGPIDSLRSQGRGQFLRYKRTGAGKYEKEIIKRKDNIRSLLSVKEGDTLAQDKLDKFIQDIRQQHKWYNLSNKDIQARLESYVNQEPQHIFETVDEAMYIYQFIEQVEKSAAYQLGYDITSGGTRDFDIDLSQQNIDKIAEKETDDRKKAAIKDIRRRFAMNNWEDFWDWAGTIAWTGWSSYTSAFAAIVANGMAGGVVHPLLATGIGLAGGAVAGPLEVLLTRAITRKLRNWYFKYPEKGQKERGSHFKLSFNPDDLHDPDRRDLGLTLDPIRQLFQNKGSKLTMDFLQRCENFRVDLANGVGFHEPETLAGWIDLSDRVLGEATQGMEIPHRIALAHKIQQILEQEYRKDTGGHKQLEELELEERVKVVTDAFDIISQVEGGETLAPIIKKVMIARAKGEPLEEGVTKALTDLADAINKGRQVFHPKESPITLEGKERELQEVSARKDKQTNRQTRYSELLTQIHTEEDTVRNNNQELSSIRKQKGHKKTVTHEGTGEIGDLETRKRTAQTEYEKAFNDNGRYDSTTNQLVGLLKELKDSNSDLNVALTVELNSKVELEERSNTSLRLKQELSRNRTEPPTIRDKKGNEIPNPKKYPQTTIDAKQAEIDLLDEGVVAEDGSIAQAKQAYLIAQTEKATIEALVVSLQKIFDKNSNLIELYSDEDPNKKGSAAWYDSQIQAAEKVISDAENTNKTARAKLKTLTNERDQLLKEVFGIDVTTHGVEAPSAEKIVDITKETTEKVTKLEAELIELRQKKEAGVALTVSEEDKETERGLIKLADSDIYNPVKFNALIEDIINGNIKIDDLAKTLSDEGYHLLLKRIFGIDALSQGVNSNYNLTSRILSKGRLAEAIMDVWQLDVRATANAFFAGDEAGLQAYQDSQTIRGEISDLTKRVSDIEKSKAEGWEDQVRDLRRQLNSRQVELNNSLSILYDTRLVSLLAQDRVSTAQVIRKTLIKISKDAIEGNPFNELLTVTTAGPRTETVTTKQGRVSLTEADKNERTGILNKRSAIKAENIDDTGISYEVDIDNTDPEGRMNVKVHLKKDNVAIRNLPDDPAVETPAELVYLLYGNVYRRKAGITATDFNHAILDTIPHANRQVAIGTDFPPALLDLIYGPDPADGKKNMADIVTALGLFDVNTLPYERENFTNVSNEVVDYFYEFVLNKRRTVNEINNFITGLPADRDAAEATAGFPPELLDQIYKSDKSRKNPGEIDRFVVERTGIPDIDRFEELVSIAPTTMLTENFYMAVGESIGRLSASDRLLYLKNKFTTFAITGAAGAPVLEAAFENGEINVYYDAGGAVGRVNCRLIDFVKMTSERADNVHPSIVSYITSNPADQQRLIREIGKHAVEAMRKVV